MTAAAREGVLLSEWDRALCGADQGERTRMAYWVDQERYPETEGAAGRLDPGQRSWRRWIAPASSR